ncbi:MAG: AAC(3) family N-acetyltransferase [Lachnospiraceae bacterium]|nr:AAC(3) family N-acetyltransferase [Lachnospiraceae bacterium]
MIKKLFEVFPYLEVLTRQIYKFALGHGFLKKRVVPNEKAKKVQNIDIKALDDFLDRMGVKEGDTLIVHSSMSGIKGFGITAEELIERLEIRIGEEGMLFMPTYPDYESNGMALSFDEIDEKVYTYSVKDTKGWTGYITEVFRKKAGTKRSFYPNNTLSARGKNVERVFEGELDTDLAFDKKSAWNYCMKKHAKVLFLGIHAHHSISEIHIAEDLMDEEWPVKGWYTTRKYKIILDNGETVYKDCRVRKNYWTKYMVEYNGCARLRKSGNLIEEMIGNICVSCIPDICMLEQYVEENARKGDLIYFKIPRKYRK